MGSFDGGTSSVRAEELDPLGAAYCAAVPAEVRRAMGQTFTPPVVIDAMIAWAKRRAPVRVVDPGAGSGRFTLAAASAFPDAEIVACELDPSVARILRANVESSGHAERITVHEGDYRRMELAPVDGATLFIGNPPYVRHHDIDPEWKDWLRATARGMGLPSSSRAGLHAHFLLATARLARSGDFGAFVTSAEWLDTGYGAMMRDVLRGTLGGESVHLIDATAEVFPDAMTTAAVLTFEAGSAPSSVRFRRVRGVADLGDLSGGRRVSRDTLTAPKWSTFTRPTRRVPAGTVELGEVCRVHRGAITGNNAAWVMARGDVELPSSVLLSTVTRAKELIAVDRLTDATTLNVVVDLPADLDTFTDADREQVNAFLARLVRAGVPRGYVASARRQWWRVGLRDPAPILATYMARRAPAFVRNDARARHINIAHGLYPRQPMAPAALDRLAAHLRATVCADSGRMYAGGLSKFEPGDMERLRVPADMIG